MVTPGELLRAYDDQLRGEVETTTAESVGRHGPLWLASYPFGYRAVVYRDLGRPRHSDLRGLVAAALERFAADPASAEVEWKTRDHDGIPGLHDVLTEHGFVAQDPESIMIGEAVGLAVDVAGLDDVLVRRVTDEAEIRRVAEVGTTVFGGRPASEATEFLLRRQALDPEMEIWVAEVDGVVVGTGRLEPVPGTEFAGIWGGAMLPEWRGRGIYRALTAARARSALAQGKKYIQSDSTEYSRPILERSGLHRVSTTTPYLWRRDSAAPITRAHHGAAHAAPRGSGPGYPAS